ncbi:MAG: GNAT family N-acetyltransferase [Christensenellales bacterium]|jgi:GNAT superfamily N-acetyltransferase
MNITFSNQITADKVNAMRLKKGWQPIFPEELQASLDGSSYIVAAYDGGEALGMARLIWDGGSKALIMDLHVVPPCEMQDLGVKLVDKILDFLRDKLKPGYGIQVDIRAWNNEVQVFENMGFQISTHERRGIPMHICLTDQVELTDAMFKQCVYEKAER